MDVFGKCLVLAGVVALCGVSGCGNSSPAGGKPSASAANQGPADRPESAASGHDHSGWWCDEHGVPEEECGQCNAKVAAAFQKKGDWCKEHDRPDSQCFICHPEKEALFAAKYEAKFGKKPPKPAVN